MRGAAALGVVFSALVALHWDALTLPPLGDFAVGVWAEGSYLSRHGFDYAHLWRHEQYHALLGARAYVISVLATVVAVLLRLCGSAERAIIAYHLLTIGCGALVALGVHAILRRFVGNGTAWLAAAAVVTQPAFAVQLDLLGMDVPMTAAVVWAALLALEDRWIGAALAITLAFFFKPTAMVFGLGIVVFCLLRLAAFAFLSRRPSGAALAAAAVSIALFVFQFQVFQYGGIADDAARPRPTSLRLPAR